MSKQTKHIIFDLDGTIIDSKNEISKTYSIVFHEIAPKIFPDLESLNYGLTLHDLMKSVYGTDEQDKIVPAKQLFASIYDSSDYLETYLYEGVFETLNMLKQHGCELYIATNKRLYPTIRILKNKGINDLFSYIMANEMEAGITLSKRQMIAGIKRKGEFDEGYMVGDSVSDIKSGKEEGMVTIAINYGYEKEDVLAALNPNYSVDSFEKISTFVL